MKTLFLSIILPLGLLVLPGLSQAAMFQYVDVNGQINSVTAANPAEVRAANGDIAEHSGMIEVTSGTMLNEDMTIRL